MARPPDYEKLTNQPHEKISEDERFPLVFSRDHDQRPDGSFALKPGHHLPQRVQVGRPKKARLRDQLQNAWAYSGDGEAALKLAAYAVGGDITDIPEAAKESLQSLTAWVFAMRAVGGSVEHFREIGDRVDPKPRRIEIEGVTGARRGGVSNNPDEAAEASNYYRLVSGEVVDAEVVSDDDLSFLD